MKIHQGKLGSYIIPGAVRQAQQNIEAGIIIRSGVMDIVSGQNLWLTGTTDDYT